MQKYVKIQNWREKFIVNCAYCGDEMEKGNLKTNGGSGLFYIPYGKDYGEFSKIKKIKSEGGIILDGPYLTRFHKISVESYVCRSCRKIVVLY